MQERYAEKEGGLTSAFRLHLECSALYVVDLSSSCIEWSSAYVDGRCPWPVYSLAIEHN